MAIISAQHPWDPSNPAGNTLFHEENGALLQWPVKLWKISSVSPFFHNAHLLINNYVKRELIRLLRLPASKSVSLDALPAWQ